MRLTCQRLLQRSIQCMLLIFLFSSQVVTAQSTRVFKGVITNDDGQGVPGVTLQLKGTNVTTLTDDKGAFSIDAAEGSVIVITSVGYNAQEYTLRGNGSQSIRLSISDRSLDQVVIVGYGTQKRRDLTGSVATINVNEAKKFSTSDISQLLQGRAAGVAVNSDGQPGSVPMVRIRGFSTFGNAQPYYVVDGVPGAAIRDFSPNDIESVTVLKDAAAAAIYGAAAANGVIMITTKQGKKNTPLRIEYNGSYGVDKIWQITDVTNREQYQMLNNESRVNGMQPLHPANNPADPGFINNIDTDWQKEGLKTGTRQNHNINLSGGGDFNMYNISLDYFDQEGTYVGNGPTYTRYTARVNNTAEKGIFKTGQSFSYSHSHENSLTFRDDILLGGIPPLINSLVIAIPTMKVYDSANLGGYGGSDAQYHGENSLNGIGINNILENYVDVDRTFANIYGELKLLKNNGHNLRFRTSVSYDKTVVRDYIWQPAFYLGKFYSQPIARLSDNSRIYTNSAIENTLNYDKNFGKHSVQLLLGQSYREGGSILRQSRSEGFTTPYYPVINNGTSRSAGGVEFKNSLSSLFGRANYSFDDRYLISASLRRDGSSRFAPANKYGYFPAASVGWNISNEKFWNVSTSAVSQLKLRASYGKLGNDNIADYQFQSVINSGIVYTFNDVRYTGGLQTSVVSEKIKWESKTITNAGFDATFMNGKFDLTAEYYNTKSEDVLVGVPIPATVGSINLNPIVNAASLQNSGIEIALGYHKNSGKFRFDVSANFSTVENKVLSLGGNNEPISGTGARTAVGGEVGRHYGYIYEGIFQTAAEVAAHATQQPNVGPGDVKYRDISGPNGRPDGVISEAFDRVYLGSGIPKYHYGLNFSASFQQFDFSLFASGSAKFLINSRFYRDLMHSGGSANYHTDMLDRWTPTNTNTDIPRLNSADVNNFRDSNRPGWLQDGSYLRINTLSVGYTLPANLIKGLIRSRIYATVQNLYTFQEYKGYNPDFTSGVFNPGFDFGSYPKPRTIMIAIQVVF